MAISLASLKKTTAKSNPLIFLYGVEGVGKDTLAAEFPAPVLIQTPGENPPSDVSVDSFGEVKDFDTLMSAFEALFAEQHEFATLIVSAVDGIDRIAQAEACKRNGWNSIEDPGFGKGYVEAETVWTEILEPIRALGQPVEEGGKGMTVILIGHVEIKNFDDPASTTYSRYLPNLQKRSGDLVRAAADVTAFLNFRVSIKVEKQSFGTEKKEANGAGIRMIYLEERPGFIAKNRYSMPPELRYDKGKGYKALAAYFGGGAK